MAEAFGAVAGVFGVISLGIQLAESVQKVKSFHANFKQACPRLADLVEEIGETCDLIEELEHHTPITDAATGPLTCGFLSSSRKAVEYFAKVASELESYTKRKRIRGSLRFALSQHEIARMLSRMERAKTLLTMAYMQYLSARQRQQYDIIAQGFERLASGQKNILQRVETASADPQAGSVKSVVARKSCGKNLQRIFEVRTPAWMTHKIWQLALDKSISGWQFTMRTYGVVSRDDPIIKACQIGDTVAMQRLFDTGAASPFDQTSEGFELVSVSQRLVLGCQ